MSNLALPAANVGMYNQMDPLEKAVRGFLSTIKNPKTYAAYTYDMKVFLAWCEREEVHPLTASRYELQMYLNYLTQDPRGYAESTIYRRWGTVCGFYRIAVRDDLVAKDQTLLIDRPGVDVTKQKCTFLPPVEFASFLKVASQASVMDAALIALIGIRGLRVSEACGLNVDNVVEAQGYKVLHYVGKGGKAHRHVLPVPAQAAVVAAIGDRQLGPVLLNQWGNRMDRACANRVVKRIAMEAGVDTDISPHSLRRSLITTALVMGKDLYAIANMVGHSDPKTTSRYDRLKGDLNRDESHAVAGFLSALAG